MEELICRCLSTLLFVVPVLALSEAAVSIIKDNNSLVFDSADASFTPRVPSTGICGVLQSASPLNACVPLSNVLDASDTGSCSIFALVLRGDCSFDVKVRHAQDGGFAVVLVVDNLENTELITMAGNNRGVTIPAVFISKIAGDVLSQYANDTHAECWILPSYENVAWLVMVISFISLIAITAVFGFCFLIQQRRSRQLRSRRRKETTGGISFQVVKSMPSTIYQSMVNGSEFFDACSICLEDYVDGAKLRTLPCNHRFHCLCIDAWLVNWRGFCPNCKQDVAKVVTERTPLLNSNGSSQQPGTIAASNVGVQAVTPQEVCIDPNRPPPSQEAQACHFFFGQLPPIRMPTSRHLSFTGLSIGVSRQRHQQDSVEAFRASPYFTPPSFVHNSAPNVLSPLRSVSSDSQFNGGSLLESSLCGTPFNVGDSQLQ